MVPPSLGSRNRNLIRWYCPDSPRRALPDSAHEDAPDEPGALWQHRVYTSARLLYIYPIKHRGQSNPLRVCTGAILILSAKPPPRPAAEIHPPNLKHRSQDLHRPNPSSLPSGKRSKGEVNAKQRCREGVGVGPQREREAPAPSARDPAPASQHQPATPKEWHAGA